MWDVIKGLMASGVTILLTTQYLEEADKLADRIAVLDQGKIIAEGTADTLKAGVGSERIEVVIEKPQDFESATKLLSGAGVQIDNEERSISVPIDGSVGAVKRVLDLLHDAKIEIDTMSVHKPTLDDVFLHLTGRGVEKGEEKVTA